MNIYIRPWQLNDASDIATVINNKKVLDNLRDGIPFPYTEKDGAEFISAMQSADKYSTYAFAITVDGNVAGSIGAFRQANIHSKTAELGYYVGEDYWGKGVCTIAVKLLCDYIFDNTDIIRIYAEPFSYNAASCRVLEKSGFQFEGTLRSNAIKNGKVIDMNMYSRIKNDTVIQKATRDDLYNIAAFLDNSWRTEYRQIVSDDFLDEMKVETRYNGLLKRFDEKQSDFLMMFLDNKMIGAAVFGKSFTQGYENDGEISAIYLDSEYIGKGYGHKLFVEIEQALINKGYENLVLDLLSDNNRAYNFYLKHGYKKVADRGIKLGDNEYPLAVMRKKARKIMSDITFRKLEWNDINRFIKLRKIQLLEEGAEETCDITGLLLDFYKRHFEDGTFVSWVAVCDNEIIATSGMSFVEKPPYYSNPTGRIGILSSMYTLPDYRRKGIAKKLLGLVINEAKEYGCGVVHITASDLGVPLYENFGFERNSNFFQYRI